MKTLSIDIETRSSVDIGASGSWKYLEQFDLLLLSYAVDYGEVHLIDTANGETVPQWFIDALTDPEYIKTAFNAHFEFGAFQRLYGNMKPEQWRCTMLKSLYNGLPASLKAVGEALGLPSDAKKDAAGKALIKFFCVPQKDGAFHAPSDDPEKWELFKEYNRQDVVAEMAIAQSLPEVPAYVQHQWGTDLRINMRGVPLDIDLIRHAKHLGDTVTDELTMEAQALTGLENPNSPTQLKSWLKMSDITAEAVKDALKDPHISKTKRRVLEIRQELSKSSLAKYDAMIACCGDGNRARGMMKFYGANRSGRWAGALLQVQNLPRTYIQEQDIARQLIRDEAREAIELGFGSVSDTLSQMLRTMLVCSDGRKIIDADFSAIEARVLAWLAGERWVLDTFASGGDIYCATASRMFGVPCVKHGINGELRQKGKQATLSCGYGGGVVALKNFGADKMGMTEPEMQDIVNQWRKANPNIVGMWHKFGKLAMDCVSAGKLGVYVIPTNGETIVFHRVGNNMHVRLPSRRELVYRDVSVGEDRFGSPSISYMGMNQVTHKWGKTDTYGGKLAENITQSVARDILAEAIDRLEAAGYEVLFSIHDEVVIDGKQDQKLDDVVRRMSITPRWAAGLPLTADGWEGSYFTKD